MKVAKITQTKPTPLRNGVPRDTSSGSSSEKGIQKLTYILSKSWKFLGQEG
jgi:hypothetical protein